MSKHSYIINVSGRIIVTVGNHYAQGYGANGYASLDGKIGPIKEYTYDTQTHSVDGDLILDGTKRVPPYAVMSAEGGIADLRGDPELFKYCMQMEGGFIYLPGYDASLGSYRNNIEEISSLLNHAKTNDKANNAFLRGLYVDAFSVIELFLGDFLLCGIFSDDNCYERLFTSKHFGSIIKRGSSSLEIETVVLSEIEKTVFHKFNKVREIYKQILEIDLPDSSKLESLLHRRHNIVHRFSYSNIDRIRQYVPCREDVHDLIEECDSFVSELRKRVRNNSAQ